MKEKDKKTEKKATPPATPVKKRKKTETLDRVVIGNQFIYPNPVTAWDEIIKLFINRDKRLFDDGHGADITNSLHTNDLTFWIENPVFQEDFDFGYYFNYGPSKWTGLLNNYIDLDKLDVIKDKVRELEVDKVKNRNYNIGLHFADSHDNGKGCLLSGILSRHYYIEKPIFTVVLRTSEVVTRLPFDLLFFSRVGEYIYGHMDFTIKIDLKQAYADDSVILMYNNREPLEKVLKGCEFKKRKESILKKYGELMAIREEDFTTYQAHLRAFKVLRPDLYPDRKPLLAKNCEIGNWDGIPLPDVCPSIIDRNNIKKMYLKFTQKYGLNMEKLMQGTSEKTKKKKVIKVR